MAAVLMMTRKPLPLVAWESSRYVAPATCEFQTLTNAVQTYEMLQNLLGISEQAWTSDTRGEYTGIPFGDFEGDYADFTFLDTRGLFTNYLAETYPNALSWTGKSIKYHVEVKSTEGLPDEYFKISQNQMDMARKYRICDDTNPTNVYVIMRVATVSSGSPVFAPYVDLWSMHLAQELDLYARTGYAARKI